MGAATTANRKDDISRLQRDLRDRRGMEVVFLSHCILNENTRYLGGACCGGCVGPIVEQCIENEWGMVQMPCPEQRAWGGVLKRWMLRAYGVKHSPLYRPWAMLLPAFILYTGWVYRGLAKRVAGEIQDYLASGFSVVGIVGIDGSPSCGLHTTLDIRASFERMASIELGAASVDKVNAMVRQSQVTGQGLFTRALRSETGRRGLAVEYLAHDLIAELSGNLSRLEGLSG